MRDPAASPLPRAAAVVLLLLQVLRCSHARVEIITDNPSPFAAVDPDAPKFIVSLYDDASKAPVEPPEGVPGAPYRYYVMTASGGRRYNCTLPPLPGQAAAGGEVATASGDLPSSAPPRTPFDLLEPLTAICLYHKDATWTYEMCHRSRVRQFRQESNGKTEEFSCGAYNGDEVQKEDILGDTSASGRPVQYVVHRFGNGARCHLTGQPRTAEVRYTCLRDTSENLIASVREFPTCNYVVLVSTPLLCQHPAFKPKPEDLRLVSCAPLEPPAAAAAPGGEGDGARPAGDGEEGGEGSSKGEAAAEAGAAGGAGGSSETAVEGGGGNESGGGGESGGSSGSGEAQKEL